ncbi:type II toxin-antitoxin system HicB family antitoxin [bacterium]|nr:type II toxin-antitoxin system HicB family antitoxin [bacterium]
MRFLVTIEPEEDGGFVVECQALPGCVSHGDTEELALENIRAAITVSLRTRADTAEISRGMSPNWK